VLSDAERTSSCRHRYRVKQIYTTVTDYEAHQHIAGYDTGLNDLTVSKGVLHEPALTAGQELPPTAPLLMHSLRALGYTTAAALANLVDNSIAAGAHRIAISFRPVPTPFLFMLDDGCGMDQVELVEAMRFGSRDPREPREGMDLGRFGLGLKTASLSQCRRLTVVSLKAGSISVARWDIDECDRRRSWWLEQPDPEAVDPEVTTALLEQGHGTAIIWEELDRLVGSGSGPVQRADMVVDSAANWLALSFHRFLSGEMVGPFSITLNERPLGKLDPFLEGHVRGQSLHAETLTLEGRPVRISPFVLPFPSRLRGDDLDRAGGRESLKVGHGFYIYRGGRLVVPGGWFRIVPADELVRLARIRVDVPVELDHIWKIDVRKTTVEPPLVLRDHLRRIVGAVTNRSRLVYGFRGRRVSRDEVPLWARHELRDGAAAWRINREHPVVMARLSGAFTDGDAERVLKLIEESVPVHDIHVHVSNDLPVAEPQSATEADLEDLARRHVQAFSDKPDMVKTLLDRLPLMDPFNRQQDAAHRIVERLRG
jgi:hypothetical protein